MVKVLLSACAIIALSGCGDNLGQRIDNRIDRNDVNSTDSHDNNSVYVDQNGSYTETHSDFNYTQDGSGVDENGTAKDPYFGDVPYNANMSQSECTEAGYFWCSIEQRCLNKPRQGSTCSAR